MVTERITPAKKDRWWPHDALGEPGRPALLFLHGFMGSAQDWRTVARICANEYACILADLPGHGANRPSISEARLDFHGWSEALVALADGRKLDPVCLIGYSLGARLALHAAWRFPKRWTALVLEGCNPGIEDPRARRARSELDERRAAQLAEEGMQPFVEGWYQADLFASLQQRPDLLDAVKQARARNDPAWMAKVLRELSPGAVPDAWPRLALLDLPTLLIAGELDTAYGAIARRMRAHLPGAQALILPGAGHNAHLEQPQAFAAALLDFLRGVFS